MDWLAPMLVLAGVITVSLILHVRAEKQKRDIDEHLRTIYIDILKKRGRR